MSIYDIVPMVVENNGRTERAYDIYSLLLSQRIVMLGTEVNSQSANLTHRSAVVIPRPRRPG
jgi:ATP-dependent Clp protease protease subunit